MEGVRAVPELRGIIPNSFAHVFGKIAKAEGDTRYGSLYCEKILHIVQTILSAWNIFISILHIIL